MRWLFSFLLILALAVALALFAEFNHGNVSIFSPPYRVDISVNVAVVGLIVAFLAMHAFLIALARLLDLPNRVQRYRSNRQELSTSLAFRDAVTALFEGRFGRSERLAEIAASDSKYTSTAALVAARAAHRMREFERRDDWMNREQASDKSNIKSNAHLMTVAELAIEERNETSAQQAIDAVAELQSRGARQVHAQRTALRAFEITENWPEVIRLCRLLYKKNALHPTASRGLLARAHRAILRNFGDDLGALKKHWNDMSAAEHSWPEIIDPAAQAFARAGELSFATKLVSNRLDASYSGAAAELYASFEGIPGKDRLQRLEAMLSKIGPDPALLKALGRVCLSLQLWGKAEDYLKRSAKELPSVDTFLMLADLFEKTDREPLAFEVYRQAAKLSQATVA
jgi:HemY protein